MTPTFARGPYAKVYTQLWNSPSFQALSRPQPNAQTLWTYLLMPRQRTCIPGVVNAGVATIAESLGWPLDATRACLAELVAAGMAEVDPAGLIWLPNASRFDGPLNPNVVTSWRTAWGVLPSCPLKARIWSHWAAVFDARGRVFRVAFDTACPVPSVPSASAVSSGVKTNDRAKNTGSRNDSPNDSANHSPNPEAGSRKPEATLTHTPGAYACEGSPVANDLDSEETWVTDEELADVAAHAASLRAAEVPPPPPTPRCPESVVAPSRATTPVVVVAASTTTETAPPSGATPSSWALQAAARLAGRSASVEPGKDRLRASEPVAQAPVVEVAPVVASSTSASVGSPPQETRGFVASVAPSETRLAPPTSTTPPPAPPAIDRGTDPKALEILAALESYPSLRSIATLKVAEGALGLLMGQVTLPDILTGLADLAVHAAMQDWTNEYLKSRVVHFAKTACQRRRDRPSKPASGERSMSRAPGLASTRATEADEPPAPPRKNVWQAIRDGELAATGTGDATGAVSPVNDATRERLRAFLSADKTTATPAFPGRTGRLGRPVPVSSHTEQVSL